MKVSPSAVAIAARVKTAMRDRGLTQEALAKLSGVSKSAIGYLVNYRDAGDRHAALDTVDAIARALDVPVATLLAPLQAKPARMLHSVGEQGAPYAAARPLGHGMDDADLLAFVIEQADSLPRFRQLSAAERAKVIAKAYVASASDERKPTAARVLRLLRSA